MKIVPAKKKKQEFNEITAVSSDYKTVLLTALDVDNASQKEQQKAQLAQVEPFVFTDHHGEQHHLLGTFRNLTKLTESTQSDSLTESFQFFPTRHKRSCGFMNDIDYVTTRLNHPSCAIRCPPHSMETPCKQVCETES
jgi:hypothetical protein